MTGTIKYSELSDQDLVTLLLQSDPGAWDYVLLDLVTPLTRSRKYVEILGKHGLSTDILISRVWMILEKDDYRRLRAFRFGASFRTYLFIIVREAQKYEIQEKIGKNPYLLSDDDDFGSQIAGKEGADSPELKDEMQYANELLSQVWQENPLQAWVLIMRNGLKLSAKEVGTFLNESSSNVDQLNKRAKEKMKILRKEGKKS